MSYVCRIDEHTTVSYSNGTVTITHSDIYWGREESSSVPISNIKMLIKALQDIEKQRSYDEW